MEEKYFTAIDRLISRITDDGAPRARSTKLTGLSGSAGAFYAAELFLRLSLPSLYITTEKRFEDAASNLEFFLRDASDRTVFLTFPSWDFAPYEPLSPTIDTSIARIRALWAMSQRNAPFLIALPIQSLITKIIPERFINSRMTISMGKEAKKESVIYFLLSHGYSPCGMVVNPGGFASRGGIIDFFGPLLSNPVRIEFFGDIVESIRTFDPETQRSIEPKETVEIVPASELILTNENLKRGIKWLRKAGAEHNTPVKKIREMIEDVREFHTPPGMERYAGAFYGEMGTIFDYLPENALIFLENPHDIEAEADRFYEVLAENHKKAAEKKEPILPPEELALFPGEVTLERGRRVVIELNPTLIAPEDHAIAFETYDLGSLRKQVSETPKGEPLLTGLASKIIRAGKEGNRVALVCGGATQARRMSELLSSYGIEIAVFEQSFRSFLHKTKTPAILIWPLSKGFEDPGLGLIVITEEEVFGARAKVRRAKKRDLGEEITSIDPLAPGDFIVHETFGIGIYRGLVNLTVMEISGDFVHLEYEDGDRLYLPVEKLFLIHRYRGEEGAAPKLDKLGSGAWERSKKKAEKAIFEIAHALASLYAARKALPGFRFTPPGREYSEFESSFPYDETPDQARAIEDIIHDMTAPYPMDRLVAGDVGYGKTEVAIRAAFIAAMSGKQVTMIVPTTILAEQHYNTFRERLKDYPFEVRMLSRFLSKKEQNEAIERLKKGTVDILIGTHRLLSKDIAFKNLGLLIIDEEHRFGVTHKEKLVALKSQIDVLSMTATPIPRTLSMSMLGIRDFSVINTAPPGRLSVKTYISEFDVDIIREAVTREISRGGQVFFVHNRVRSIVGIKRFLEKNLPGIRIGLAHGQMSGDELERVMIDFIDKKTDILLSSAIIESGIDIPSANTIIINCADTFGLAQLYQLRGRVGRSNTRAYAYLLISNFLSLSPDAKKRLRVISEFSDLGSGFKIATYDLEIRGAGNLLGKDQSGHINAVGYDLYLKMIEDAIRELKGMPREEALDVEINLPVSAYIPQWYIPDSALRLHLYRRLISADDSEGLEELSREMLDRFGAFPEEVKNLIALSELRLTAKKLHVTSLRYQKGTAHLTFSDRAPLDTKKLVELVTQKKETYHITKAGILQYKVPPGEKQEIFNMTKNLLQTVSQYVTF